MNIQKENYKLIAQGKIQGGSASYSADLDTGKINYQALVNLPWYCGGDQQVPKKGDPCPEYDVPSVVLLSSSIKVGSKTVVGPATFTCLSLENGQASMAVNIDGLNMPQGPGAALLDVSGPSIKLISLGAVIKVSVLTLTIQLVRA